MSRKYESSSGVSSWSISVVTSISIAVLAGCSDLPVRPVSDHWNVPASSGSQSIALAGVDVRGEYILNGSSRMYLRSQDAVNGWILGHGAFISEPYTYGVTGTVSGSTL